MSSNYLTCKESPSGSCQSLAELMINQSRERGQQIQTSEFDENCLTDRVNSPEKIVPMPKYVFTAAQVEEWLRTVDNVASEGQFEPCQVQQSVLSYLCEQLSYIRDVTDVTKKLKVPSRRVLVQGKSGTGKSTLLQAIVSIINNGLKEFGNPGEAIHVLRGGDLSTSYLSGNDREQRQLKQVWFLLVDDAHLLGSKALALLDERYRQSSPVGCKNDDYFGGRFVYFLGDFRHLASVSDVGDTSLISKKCDAAGRRAFSSFHRFFELKTPHRMTNQREIELLDNLATGKVTTEDYELLKMRCEGANFCYCDTTNCRRCQTRAEFENKGIRLLLTAQSKGCCRHIVKDNATNGEQVQKQILPGCRVLLRHNFECRGQLINAGALGTVRAVICAAEGQEEVDGALPLYVLVHFDDFAGPFLVDRLVPIIPVSCQDKNDSFSRQLPLALICNGVSIREVAGLTLKKIIIDIEKEENSFTGSMAYFAISRVQKFEDLIIKGVPWLERLRIIGSSEEEVKIARALSGEISLKASFDQEFIQGLGALSFNK